MKNTLYDEKKYPKNMYPWTKAEGALFFNQLKKQYDSYEHKCEFKNHYGEQVCLDCDSYEICQEAWYWDGK